MTSIFPTQYSTLSAVALNNYIQSRYGFQGTTCRILMRNVSDTYVISNETNKWVFKIYRDAHRKYEEISGEVELLEKLRAGGASVSYPVRDQDGVALQKFQAAEGIRYGVLFSWAKGEVSTNLSHGQLQTLGHEMARLHNISAGIDLAFPRKPFNLQTTIHEPLAVLKPAFAGLDAEYNYLYEKGIEIAAALEKITSGQTNTGYIQFDFLPKNFHFDTDDNVTFFDFDFAGKGWIANDLMSFLVCGFFDVMNNRSTIAEARESFAKFMTAYKEVRPINDEEIAALPLLGYGFWLFYLQFAYDNFDDWSNSFFTSRYLAARTGHIKSWLELAPQLI
ncbi:phosphotransferase enzyme family protein [Chitinophaga sp. Cy-1792]|uniref:phosphotransferase enzyme family protein n=1 Tax=Chitinophaga sp. Cy-1792 TaxID=2608339 RepID=UPI001420E79E|nr:phosphotransferase [Chitinophaga sp. Cy-1792]NIG54718.1 phosphotransferase [Chitinophaga sp. Cy-1792]